MNLHNDKQDYWGVDFRLLFIDKFLKFLTFYFEYI